MTQSNLLTLVYILLARSLRLPLHYTGWIVLQRLCLGRTGRSNHCRMSWMSGFVSRKAIALNINDTGTKKYNLYTRLLQLERICTSEALGTIVDVLRRVRCSAKRRYTNARSRSERRFSRNWGSLCNSFVLRFPILLLSRKLFRGGWGGIGNPLVSKA